MGEAEELAGHTDQCRKIAVVCLKRFPLSENVWKRFVTQSFLTLDTNGRWNGLALQHDIQPSTFAFLFFFLIGPDMDSRIMRMWTGSMSQESMEMIMNASLLSPLAARMSKMVTMMGH